ncbi:MAG: hypothetical protein AAB214_19095 [Fibrobacterota bacterium]
MAIRLPIIGLVLGLAGTCLSATPGMFELGITAPSGPGGHLAYSTYFGETKFLQIRLEESIMNFRPRISNAHHALLGAGYEQEFSSHLFLRVTAGLGIGQAAFRDQPGPSRDTYFSSVRIAPDLTWFPGGRFSTIGLGLNAGVNLQSRQALGDRALPTSISNQGVQIFAGLVL